MTEAIAVKIEDVCKGYNGTQVLKEVRLQIRMDEFYVLMGPNGSGKSTLLSIVAGTSPADSGRIEILSRDVFRESEQAKSYIGYVPQENFCSAFLTGRENLEYFAGLLGLNKSESKRRIADLLKMMQLAEHANRRVAEYSGGMRKKLEVATALLGDVKVLLLDEPTTGLDPGARKDFLNLLSEINDQGTAILLVTHIGEDADAASHVGFMVDGEIVVEGTPDDLKAMSGLTSTIVVDATPRTKDLMILLASLDEGCIVKECDDGFRIASDNPMKLIPQIANALSKSGYHMHSVDTHPPSLEDVFHQLTDFSIRGEAQ